jgi:hypothetical protein
VSGGRHLAGQTCARPEASSVGAECHVIRDAVGGFVIEIAAIEVSTEKNDVANVAGKCRPELAHRIRLWPPLECYDGPTILSAS